MGVASWGLIGGRCEVGVACWALLAGSCQEGQARGTVARWELLAGSCQEGQARGTVARWELLAGMCWVGAARWELLAGSCQEGQARGTVARWELRSALRSALCVVLCALRCALCVGRVARISIQASVFDPKGRACHAKLQSSTGLLRGYLTYAVVSWKLCPSARLEIGWTGCCKSTRAVQCVS